MDPKARAIRERLALKPHPEGGYYRETYRASHPVTGAGGLTRAASTAIYVLLEPGDFSALHRVKSDEVWHHYVGSPLELHLLRPDGDHKTIRLGADILTGQEPQVVVPAGVWQGAVAAGPGFALCGCTVAPGFDFADFEMPGRDALLRLFPGQRALIESLTRL
jgi:predicted cupin superfamily sugar epimerase